MLVTGAALVMGLLGPTFKLAKIAGSIRLLSNLVDSEGKFVESYPYRAVGGNEDVYLQLNAKQHAFLNRMIITGDPDGRGLEFLDLFYEEFKGTSKVRSRKAELRATKAAG